MRIKTVVNPLKLSLALLASMAISSSSTAATNPTAIETTYQSSSANFPNPERGFYKSIDPASLTEPGPALQLADLQKIRSQGMSMVRRYYLLIDFVDKPISQAFLDQISQDFQTARKAGIKLIIRFTYNWGYGIPTDRDASRDMIFTHLEQLKPILQANSDVLAYMEAGFIGYWGEWHDSTNKHLIDSGRQSTDAAKQIVQKILSILPTERMVALRYFKHKIQMVKSEEPLSAAQAYNGSMQARIGYHNDGFRTNIHDAGTYNSDDPVAVDREKKWLNLDTKYVVHGGEPAWASDPPEYDDCPGTLADLARMRWSAMSINQHHSGAVYQGWQEQGCMQKIKRHLGYRFRLISSKIPDRVKPASTFSMSFKVINDGWASPYNPRGLEVILRNSQTSKEYYLSVPEAVRMWMPGEIRSVKVTGGIPANMPSGVYQVLLNLPDPAPKLYGRPEYSIRFANKGVWEPSTGYNSSLHKITVDANTLGDRYSGSQFFKSR